MAAAKGQHSNGKNEAALKRVCELMVITLVGDRLNLVCMLSTAFMTI
jgi:hypothetical protein